MKLLPGLSLVVLSAGFAVAQQNLLTSKGVTPIAFGAPLSAEPTIPTLCDTVVSATAVMPDTYGPLMNTTIVNSSLGFAKDPIHLSPYLTMAANSAYGGTGQACSASHLNDSFLLEACHSQQDTITLNNAIAACKTQSQNNGDQDLAIRIKTSSSYNAIVLNPVIIPAHISLLIDSGVTVYASVQPAVYGSLADYAGYNHTYCGTWVGADCRPLLAFTGTNSGIYGYGVIDGRGSVQLDYNPTYDANGKALVTVDDGNYAGWTPPYSWYSMKDEANPNHPKNVFGPVLVQANNDNFTLYKITLRNAPYYNVSWAGIQGATGPNSQDPNYFPTFEPGAPALGFSLNDVNIAENFTAWGVKIAAPWIVANTDAFDVQGVNITIAYTDISNGDDQMAVSASAAPSQNIQARYINGYAKNGLNNGDDTQFGISYMDIENANLTGDVPQFGNGTVNGQTLAYIQSFNSGMDLQHALPTITGNINGLILKTKNNLPAQVITGTAPTNAGGLINSVYYNQVCMQDLNTAISHGGGAGSYTNPVFADQVTYSNIRVMTPTSQSVDGPVIALPSGNGNTTQQTYNLNWGSYDWVTLDNGMGAEGGNFTLNNVSFDNATDPNNNQPYSPFTMASNYNVADANRYSNRSAEPTDGILLEGSYFPIALAGFGGDGNHNTETFNNATLLTSPLTSVCNASPNTNFPSLNGEIFFNNSVAGDHPTLSTNTTYSIQAVVQPSTRQPDLYLRYVTPNTKDFPNGVYDVGAPALSTSGKVTFYFWNSSGSNVASCPADTADHRRFACQSGSITAALTPGTYAVTAKYDYDTTYPTFTFGPNMTPEGAPDATVTGPNPKFGIMFPGASYKNWVSPTLTITN